MWFLFKLSSLGESTLAEGWMLESVSVSVFLNHLQSSFSPWLWLNSAEFTTDKPHQVISSSSHCLFLPLRPSPLRQGLIMYPWLPWNLYRSAWSFFLSAGTKDVSSCSSLSIWSLIAIFEEGFQKTHPHSSYKDRSFGAHFLCGFLHYGIQKELGMELGCSWLALELSNAGHSISS